MKMYVCPICGNIIEKIYDSKVPVVCCGKKMEELAANTVEASQEKHIPLVEVLGDEVKVTVGAVEHPMISEHFIGWIYLKTENGLQVKKLNPGDAPVATFLLKDDKAVAAYAYCNLHGLWMAEITEPFVCDLKPLDVKAKENYVVCRCNNVSYFDILDAVQKNGNIEELLDVFEAVKNTTQCSTGCGGCYEKVIAIISEAMSAGAK